MDIYDIIVNSGVASPKKARELVSCGDVAELNRFLSAALVVMNSRNEEMEERHRRELAAVQENYEAIIDEKEAKIAELTKPSPQPVAEVAVEKVGNSMTDFLNIVSELAERAKGAGVNINIKMCDQLVADSSGKVVYKLTSS